MSMLEGPSQTTDILGVPAIPEPTHFTLFYAYVSLANEPFGANFKTLYITPGNEPEVIAALQSNPELQVKVEDRGHCLNQAYRALEPRGSINKNGIVGIRIGADFAATSVHSLNNPLSTRPDALVEAWNAPTHETFNDHSHHLAQCISIGETLGRSIRESFANLEEVMLQIHLTPEGETLTGLHTFTRKKDKVVRENRDFLDENFSGLFDHILAKLRPGHPTFSRWDMELFNSIDWECFKRMIKTQGVGKNGSSANIIKLKEDMEIELNEKTGLYETYLSTHRKRSIHRESQSQEKLSIEVQKIIEALEPYQEHCAFIVNQFETGAQAYCPILPKDGIPEGGLHTYDIITQFAIDILKKFIQTESNAVRI